MISLLQRVCSLCAAGVLLGVLLSPSTGRAQAVGEVGREAKAPAAQFQVYTLNYASADATSALLTSLMTDSEMKVSIDARMNRLIVLGSSATHQRVKALIQTLDAQEEGPMFSVVRSKDKSKAISDILKLLDLEVHVAMDPALGTIILKGSRQAVGHAQDLISQLEQVVPGGTADQSERQYNVELFIVTSGAADDPASLHNLQTDDLRSVSAALHKKGIDHPTLLAKSEIAALARHEFSASDAAFAQVSGIVEPAANGVRLEIDIKMVTDDRPVSFRTTILTKLNHPIAFASTQPRSGKARTYVLVVRVREN